MTNNALDELNMNNEAEYGGDYAEGEGEAQYQQEYAEGEGNYENQFEGEGDQQQNEEDQEQQEYQEEPENGQNIKDDISMPEELYVQQRHEQVNIQLFVLDLTAFEISNIHNSQVLITKVRYHP